MATTTSHHSSSLSPSTATPLHLHDGHSSSSSSSRHRQHYPQPTTPNDPYQYPQDIKDTQHVNPAYDQQSYHPNGPSYRSRSPLHHTSPLHYDKDTTLSTFLSNLFVTAKHQLQPHSTTSTSTSTLLHSSIKSLLPALPTDPQELKSSAGFILLCALWYLSSAFSSNTGKSIMTQFRYPVTLTFVQFAFVAGYCVVFLAARERFSALGGPQSMPGGGAGGGGMARRASVGTASGWGIKKPTKAMFQGTLMMSLFQIAGHVFSSMAIARVPVSTVHTIKALSPLFTVASYALLFGVRYGTPTYLALLPLTLGVMLACSFDLRANAIGFLCALGSTIIFVSQNIFSKKLLPKESSAGQAAPSASGGSGGGKLDKLNLLFYSSGMAFFLMIPIWLYSDASTLLSAWLNPVSIPMIPTPSSSSSSSLALSFFLNGTVHFAQNLLAFSILARTSPVTYSIASLVKRIAVICIAIIWSGQKVTPVQGLGMTMTFGGLWLYNRAKGDVDKGERKRGAVEKRQEMFLPTSVEDVRQMQATPPPPPPPPHPHPHLSNPQPYAHPTPNYVADVTGGGQSQPRNRSLTSSQPLVFSSHAGGQHHHPHPHPPPPPPPQSSGLRESHTIKAR